MSSLTKNRTAVAAASSLEKDYEKNLIDAVPEQVIQVDELPELLEGGGAFAGMFVSFGWVNCIAIFQQSTKPTN
jgi:hypothetical protein